MRSFIKGESALPEYHEFLELLSLRALLDTLERIIIEASQLATSHEKAILYTSNRMRFIDSWLFLLIRTDLHQ